MRIPFTTVAALSHVEECELEGMLADFTLATNVDGLVFGACGPVVMRSTNLLPHMRFVPHVLLLADGEDMPGTWEKVHVKRTRLKEIAKKTNVVVILWRALLCFSTQLWICLHFCYG